MKKILSIALVVVLLAGIAVSGTMAYLTDTDSAVNVMTLGNVDIEQIEQERDANGGLQDFTQAKPAYPAVGPIAWANEGVDVNGTEYKVFTDDLKNVVDKIVTVENTGKSDAYVRTIVAIEAPEYDPNDLIHINYNGDGLKLSGPVTAEIDGVEYVCFAFTYDEALAPDEISGPSLMQLFLDSEATNEDVAKFGDTWEVLVLSQAVQTAGFDSAEVALTAGFGAATAENVKAWFEGSEAKVPVVVESQDALKKAIADGEKDILVTGAELTEKLPLRSDVNATFVDCEINGNNAWGYANNATFQNCTFDSGAANAAIHFDQLYGKLVVNNCVFKSGKVQIGTDGDSSAEFNNCTFGATATTSIWAEMGMRFYCPTEFNNCEFNNRVVLAGSNGLSLTFNSCTMNGGSAVYYVDNTDGIIRGGNIPAVTIK